MGLNPDSEIVAHDAYGNCTVRLASSWRETPWTVVWQYPAGGVRTTSAAGAGRRVSSAAPDASVVASPQTSPTASVPAKRSKLVAVHGTATSAPATGLFFVFFAVTAR